MPDNLFQDRVLNFNLKAATVHIDRATETEESPYECTTVALWEDLYNKKLLKGYSNASQVPPFNKSQRKIDIGTFYYADLPNVGFRRIAMTYTEAKRAALAKGSDILVQLDTAEEQLFQYCQSYLRAKRPEGSGNRIYGNLVVGAFIRCFVATINGQGSTATVTFTDVFSGKPRIKLLKEKFQQNARVKIETLGYLDISKAKTDQLIIRRHFSRIRAEHRKSIQKIP